MNSIIRMHGTLMTIIKKVISYVQHWTKDNLPSEVVTEHYFKVSEFEFPPVDYNIGKSLPAGYTKLSYITNTDNGYIDTGYKLQANDNVEIICKLNSYINTYPPLFGSRNAYGSKNWLFYTKLSSNNTPSYCRGNNETPGPNNSLPQNKFLRMITSELNISWYNKNNEYINGIKSNGQLIDSDYTCFIFSFNNGGTQYGNGNVRADISNFIIKDGSGVIIHDYVPAMRNSDSAYGLYDVVSNEFHQGSNSTITGTVIDTRSKIPAKAVPYDVTGQNTSLGDFNKRVTAATVKDNVAQDTSLGGFDKRVMAASVGDTVGQDTSLNSINIKVTAAAVKDEIAQDTSLGNFEVTDGEGGKIIPIVVN